MRYALLIGFLALGAHFFMGCGPTRTYEYVQDEYEEGVIEQALYTPDQHGSGVGPSFDMTGNGGMGISVVSVDIPPKWVVVISCPHGKFILDSDRHEIAKGVWEKVKAGDRVKITYRTIYLVERDRKTKAELSRNFVKYQTVGVTRIP